jgi:hypothetical protein
MWTDKDKALLSVGDGKYDYTFVDPPTGASPKSGAFMKLTGSRYPPRPNSLRGSSSRRPTTRGLLHDVLTGWVRRFRRAVHIPFATLAGRFVPLTLHAWICTWPMLGLEWHLDHVDERPG